MISSSSSRARAIIDLSAIRRNFQQVRRLVGEGVQVWPAVKADAYGHGAREVVSALAAEGADGFCVATPEEAQEIREAAAGKRRLLLGAFLGQDGPSVLACGAETAIASLAFAQTLSALAARADATVNVHLKVDTGMGRIGVPAAEAMKSALDINRLPGLFLAGLMTHFPTSDEPDLTFARQQIQALASLGQAIQQELGRELILHAANSGAILALPESYFQAVRPGVMIYGSYPSSECPRSVALEPVMTLQARIVFIKTLPAGATVSYGRTWIARRPSRIATVSLGYGDGLPRHLSNSGHAILRGRLAPIAGRVCMDQTMLDVTDIPGACLGDVVSFWGKDGGMQLPVEDVAAQVGTIPYELTCGVSGRIPRDYINRQQGLGGVSR